VSVVVNPASVARAGLHAASASKRVLVVLGTNAAWCRGILRGFMAVAHERNWTLLHYQQSTDLSWLADEWAPSVAVIGPEPGSDELVALASATLVSVTIDRTSVGIASVIPDERLVATAAADHLLATGLRRVTTFQLGAPSFAIAREQAFLEHALAAGARTAPSFGRDENGLALQENPAAIIAWLRGLPKPCGIFTCTDAWARTVARYARVIGLRVPEDVALVGADNDVLECELISPPVSSVVIPWQEIGQHAAALVQMALSGQSIEGQRVVVPPAAVAARRSSEILAIEDPLVAEAVRWIHAHRDQRLTVTMVARGVGGGRQRLERRFRAALNRTVQEEIRRAHVERAKQLLATTRAGLPEIAKQSGFTTPALLNAAFRRELGMPPGAYRRLMLQENGEPDDD
jgi:LacI family transcriptional regulator